MSAVIEGVAYAASKLPAGFTLTQVYGRGCSRYAIEQAIQAKVIEPQTRRGKVVLARHTGGRPAVCFVLTKKGKKLAKAFAKTIAG